MSLTIGRASITTDPSVLDCDGDRLSVAGWFTGSDLNHAKALRQQLLGLADNPDEPVIPFTSTVDTALDGFYRVASARVTPVLGVSYEKFQFQYAVDLERVVGGFARPVFEATIVAPVRTNGHSVTTSSSLSPGPTVFGFPQALDYDPDGLSTTFTNPEASADGDVTLVYSGSGFTSPKFVRFFVDPAEFYYASALIEIKYGSTWRAVVGRQIPTGVAGSWRISNGLVRWGPSSSTVGRGVVEVWDDGSGAWVTGDADIARGVWAGAAFTEWDMFCENPVAGTASAYADPIILRNDPAAVTVMIPTIEGGSETYTLRRGAFAVDCHHLHYQSVAMAMSAVGESVVSISSADVGGSGATGAAIKRDANDANGNRFVIGAASTADVVTGVEPLRIASAATSWSFCVGVTPNQSTTGVDDAEQIVLGFLFGTSASQRIVTR